MVESRRSVPGKSHGGLRVRIVGEQLAVFVDIDAEGIAQARGDDLPGRPVGVRADQVTVRRSALRAELSSGRDTALKTIRDLNCVAVDRVNGAIPA